MKQQGKMGYALYPVSLDGGLVIIGEGIGIPTVPISDFADAAIDTIVVPGALDMGPLRDRQLVILVYGHARLFGWIIALEKE